MSCFLVALDRGLGPLELLGGRDAFILEGGNAAGIDRFGNEGDGDAQVLRGDDRPFAGAFLAGGVEDLVHERLAVGVFEAEDVAGDLDEVGVELALVPLGKDLVHLVGAHAQAGLHQVVGLADELHVAVFDAVVDHLHVVARAVFAHPIAAGRPVIDLGGDLLEDVFHMRPGGGRAAGHDARAAAGAFFAAGNAGADVEQALGLDVFRAADRVFEEGVAAVNDDVAGFEVRDDLVNEFVHGLAGLDHEHDAAGLLEQGDHLLDGVGADDIGALGFFVEEVVHLRDGAVVSGHGEPVVVHVQNQILAHHGQPNYSNISFRFHVVCFLQECRTKVKSGYSQELPGGAPVPSPDPLPKGAANELSTACEYSLIS